MRRNASTVVVLPGPAPAEVLSAVGRSMNVALIQPRDPVDDDGDGLAAAAGAYRIVTLGSYLNDPHLIKVSLAELLILMTAAALVILDAASAQTAAPAPPPHPYLG